MSRARCDLRLWKLLTWAVLLSFSQREAYATQALRREFDRAVGTLTDVLKSLKQTEVAFGDIHLPPGVTSAPLIRQVIRDELEQRKFSISASAKCSINVECQPATTIKDGRPQPAVQFSLRLVTRNGKDLCEPITVIVAGEATFVAVLQPQVAIPADLSPLERAGFLRSAFEGKEDPPDIRGTVVFSGKRSPYGVEILVDGMPRQPTLQDREVIVAIARGETYKIRLVNTSSFDAAASVLIDGLNSFTFSEARQTRGERKGEPLYDCWMIPGAVAEGSQKQSPEAVIVPGWHIRNGGIGGFKGFQVTGPPEEGAAIAPAGMARGTISVRFAAAWPVGEEPPAALKEPGITPKGQPDSTGIGQPETAETKPVERRIGVVRANVRIRYSEAAD